jgi:hypothetical protein
MDDIQSHVVHNLSCQLGHSILTIQPLLASM